MDVNKAQEDSGAMDELEDEELCEALAVLAGSDPDKCSYPRVRHNISVILLVIKSRNWSLIFFSYCKQL